MSSMEHPLVGAIEPQKCVLYSSARGSRDVDQTAHRNHKSVTEVLNADRSRRGFGYQHTKDGSGRDADDLTCLMRLVGSQSTTSFQGCDSFMHEHTVWGNSREHASVGTPRITAAKYWIELCERQLEYHDESIMNDER